MILKNSIFVFTSIIYSFFNNCLMYTITRMCWSSRMISLWHRLPCISFSKPFLCWTMILLWFVFLCLTIMRIAILCMLYRLAEYHNPVPLRRSSLFPNLGLLFNRHGYEVLWKDKTVDYSTNGWDHWIRSMAVQMGYECIFPAFPRVYHILHKEGTTTTHKANQRVSRIPMYSDNEPVDLGDLSYLLPEYYDVSLLHALVPRHLIPDVYANMHIPLEDIIEGRKPLNTTVNELFSWVRYRNPNHKELMLISYRDEQQLVWHTNRGHHQQYNVVVASEVRDILT